ncbi:MAG: hypothetical protein H7Y22_15935 [Gemmatimonadaceae bacterium]|nr:hypothetical protein [Gloeobacterales cyanobacterium ES-bin-141]
MEAVETRHILLLRDPFNWAASFMQKSQSPGDSEIWADQWQEYADEFVGKTSYLPNALKVNYNRWFLDKKYRQSISAQLGLNFTDAGLEVVTQHAGGSSFDQAQYNQRAQQMQVMERWKHFKDDERFVNSFMKRPDIVELAQTLFDLPPELAEFAAYCRR